MNQINWGIIGCGDVTEVKSGPAFNKVNNSSLVAVMRRDREKAADYARRHQVPKWYDDAAALINDPDINAIYVATPPSSHEEYALAAIAAGKPVYVEKPVSVNAASAERMAKAAREKNIKLSVAHYRRAQPLFSRVKELLDQKIIGEPRLARSIIGKRLPSKEELQQPGKAWRVDKSIAGGGLFHDLSPHQLDLMYYFFGEVERMQGVAINQAKIYDAEDTVAGTILFKSGVVFSGDWCFNVSPEEEADHCEIFGEEGKIRFSFFEQQPVLLTIHGKTEQLIFEPLPHVQQPMIAKVVDYFLSNAPNPCSGEEAVSVMKMIDAFSS